jgi:hypothetical protein
MAVSMFNLVLHGFPRYRFVSMLGARNRVGRGLSYRPARLVHRAGGVDSLESILLLLKSLKIRLIKLSLDFSKIENFAS